MTLLAATTAVWIFILVPLISSGSSACPTSSAGTCPARRRPAGSSSSSCCRCSARSCTSCFASRPSKRSSEARGGRGATKERPVRHAEAISRRDQSPPPRAAASRSGAGSASVVASTNVLASGSRRCATQHLQRHGPMHARRAPQPWRHPARAPPPAPGAALPGCRSSRRRARARLPGVARRDPFGSRAAARQSRRRGAPEADRVEVPGFGVALDEQHVEYAQRAAALDPLQRADELTLEIGVRPKSVDQQLSRRQRYLTGHGQSLARRGRGTMMLTPLRNACEHAGRGTRERRSSR